MAAMPWINFNEVLKMKSSILAVEGASPDDPSGIAAGGSQSISAGSEGDIPCGRERISRFSVSPSISGKEWRFPPDCQVDPALVEAAGGSELLARILLLRGVSTAEEARVYLDPALYEPTSPMEFADMPRAIVRITQAIAESEKITVYGDYDVDGVTGTAVLLTVLRQLGANVDHYIPNRTAEGYGLNLKAVSVLASKHRSKLIISCDCGIANFAEINFARSLGVETIIVDHHSMPEMLPPAVAILHPKQLPDGHPLGNLSGVGVAFKLCEALLMDKGMAEQALDLLDFVTLGMIADMVPLVGENRYLVQLGLPRLAESKRPGVQALLARAKGSNGSDLVGFGLAPRINAAGRLSDANLALELMVTEDAAVAERLARQLELENARRQDLCEKIALEADQMACQKKAPGDRGVVLYKEGWHHGVVGIVASRLVEKHHCAVFIGELDAEERVIKGSARGIEGLDLYEVLKANEHLLIKWGGHKMAAGFSLELDKAEAFSRAITQTCNTMLAAGSSGPTLQIDARVGPQEVSLGLARQIERLAPFGMSNRRPALVLTGLVCQTTRLLGKEGKHSRITLCDSLAGRTFEAVLWNSRGRVPVEGSKIDVAFTPEVNAYNGQERLQLVLADWRRCDAPPAGQAAPAAVADDHPPVAGAAPQEPSLAQSPAVPVSTAPGAPASSRQDTGSPGGGAPVGDPVQATVHVPPDGFKPPPQRPALATGQVWKDLRNHETPLAVLSAAVSKLGARVSIFAEVQERSAGLEYLDRTNIAATAHLLIWQYPPSAQVFQSLVACTQAKNIYLVGGARTDQDDAAGFLRRLLAVVRFAVNQREGKAEGDKIAAALGTTKVAVALGLTVLRKINVIDWFAEDGLLYLDILDQPQGRMEDLPEFRQLAGSLKEIDEFRQWCSASQLKDIQLLVVPNHIELARASEPSRRQDELYAAEHPTIDRRDHPLYPIASDAGAV